MLVDSPLGFGRGLGSGWGVGFSARGKGRKAYLELAQDKALFDLVVGMQLSIQWVLRAPVTRSEGA